MMNCCGINFACYRFLFYFYYYGIYNLRNFFYYFFLIEGSFWHERVILLPLCCCLEIKKGLLFLNSFLFGYFIQSVSAICNCGRFTISSICNSIYRNSTFFVSSISCKIPFVQYRISWLRSWEQQSCWWLSTQLFLMRERKMIS